jgi:hypothetical protein
VGARFLPAVPPVVRSARLDAAGIGLAATGAFSLIPASGAGSSTALRRSSHTERHHPVAAVPGAPRERPVPDPAASVASGLIDAAQSIPLGRQRCWTIWIGLPSGSAVQAISRRPNHSCGGARAGAPLAMSAANAAVVSSVHRTTAAR